MCLLIPLIISLFRCFRQCKSNVDNQKKPLKILKFIKDAKTKEFIKENKLRLKGYLRARKNVVIQRTESNYIKQNNRQNKKRRKQLHQRNNDEMQNYRSEDYNRMNGSHKYIHRNYSIDQVTRNNNVGRIKRGYSTFHSTTGSRRIQT